MIRGHKSNKLRPRLRRGTSLVEAIVAAIIIIPVTLFLLDLTVIVLANSKNDQTAKNAARAAANQPDGGKGFTAAEKTVKAVKTSTIIKSIAIQQFQYASAQNSVKCQIKMIVQLPIPFPGFSQLTFIAQAVEPIVGKTN